MRFASISVNFPHGYKDTNLNQQEFTMDFMLKTLNIDLKVIGYDKAHQIWIKE